VAAATSGVVQNTEKKWSPSRKNEVWEHFVKAIGPHAQHADLAYKAWAAFCLWIADNGGSNRAESADRIIIHDDKGKSTELNSYNYVKHHLIAAGEWFTLQRFSINFCEDISTALNDRGVTSQWGTENYFPDGMPQWSFPAAIYHKRCPDEAKKALSAARRHALSSGPTNISNAYQLSVGSVSQPAVSNALLLE